VDWFKVESDIAQNPKVDDLTDGEYRALTYLWGYAMRRECGGQIPPSAPRLIPRVTIGRIRALEAKGFLEPNPNGIGGWLIHDWEEHQREALAVQDKRRRDAERKRRDRAEGAT